MTDLPPVATLAEALADPRYSHARARPFCGKYYITLYRREPSSPSGVVGFGPSVLDCPETEAAFKLAGHTSPLSPTEGLRGVAS